jgi:hypothetical protein
VHRVLQSLQEREMLYLKKNEIIKGEDMIK